jgi:hypothetical protein
MCKGSDRHHRMPNSRIVLSSLDALERQYLKKQKDHPLAHRTDIALELRSMRKGSRSDGFSPRENEIDLCFLPGPLRSFSALDLAIPIAGMGLELTVRIVSVGSS